MTAKFDIKNLHCADCARSLEEAIKKEQGVENVIINFATEKLTLSTSKDADFDDVIKRIEKLVSSFSAKVSLTQDIEQINPKKIKYKLKINYLNLSLFLIGIIGFVCLLIVNMPNYLTYIVGAVSAILIGYNTYIKAFKLLFRGVINENMLVFISVFGAIAIAEITEGLMVIILYTIGKYLEGLAVKKSRDSIKQLIDLTPQVAYIKQGSLFKSVSPSQIKVGDIMVCNSGTRVATDGFITSGSASVDVKHITGESVPAFLKQGDKILSGSIVLDGALQVQADVEYSNSTISKINKLIEQANDKKSKTETFVQKFSGIYTLIVVFGAVVCGVVVSFVYSNAFAGIYRALSFLVVACPCAFAISVPLSYFSGIGTASKFGILIKGSQYIDAGSKLNLVAFDKTGTITNGNFEVISVEPISNNFSMIDILRLACYGEQYSNHPIAKAILKCGEDIKLKQVDNVKEVAGVGISYTLGSQTVFVGKDNIDEQQDITSVVIKQNDEIIGKITLADSIKDNSELAIKNLQSLNIKTAMLSGDNLQVTKSVAEQLNITEYKASLMPEDKYNYLQQQINTGKNVAFVGDGLNDAPSLALASVGISMGINGSDASKQASDVVLTDDDPNKVYSFVKISKRTKNIVVFNILFALVVKIAFLTLSALGVTGMIFAVFADVGVTIIAILNSMRLLIYNPIKKLKNK